MKVNYIFLTTLLFSLVSSSLFALPYATVQDFERRLSETFPLSRDGRVLLDNRYGEIRVETWERSEVKVDVLIKVAGSDKEDAERVFERIKVDLKGSSGYVSAVTTIEDRSRGRSWWNILTGNGNGSSDFKIYYTVRMPSSVDLETEARYCDVTLPDLSGPTKLDVRYGDLVAGRLTNSSTLQVSYGSARVEQLGPSSTVRMRYSEGVIRNAGSLRYDGRYSETRIGKVGKLHLDVGYEEVEVGEAEEIRLDGNYNELQVERVARLFIDGNYCEFNIGTVTEELEVDASYGDLEVDNLAAGFRRVYVRTNYLDVEIDVAADAGYELDLSTRYGDISTDTSKLTSRNVNRDGSAEKLSGKKAGKGNGRIDISTSYGDIDIR